MIHKSLTDLDYSVQGKFHDCFTKMNNSELLKEMGVEKVAINETLRDLATQMAYFARGRMEAKYVKMYYAAAGRVMGEIGESCGLKWGGRWKDLPDTPHFEA